MMPPGKLYDAISMLRQRKLEVERLIVLLERQQLLLQPKTRRRKQAA